MNPSEKQIQDAIIQYLNLSGHFVIRINAGKVRTDQGRWIQLAPKGTSDIVGIAKDGKMIAVEVKARHGKLREGQGEFLEEVKKRGGYAIVARNMDDVVNFGL